MSNDALLWNHTKSEPRKPKPGEHLWSMHKNGKRVDAELRVQADCGVECQFWYDGELAAARLWMVRADAVAEADKKRQELKRRGWTPVPAAD